MGQIPKGLDYLKSIPSILKIVEFVILLICIGTVGYFLDKTSGDYKKKGNLQFYMFVVVVAWLLVMALFSLFITGLHEKVSQINWPLTVAIICAIWAVLLLISSALVADTARYYDKGSVSWCDILDRRKADAQCGQLIGGAITGFIAMALNAVDAFVHLRMFLSGRSAPPASTAGTVSS